MSASKKRVCLVGCGPSGMSFLHHWAKLKLEEEMEVVCYEKQGDWGGLWNYSWRTGIGVGGEPVHNSMYRHLWVNAAKESELEYPDYSFEKHFGKKLPSYVPREVVLHYLNGRFSQYGFRECVHFNHVVTSIAFKKSTDQFSVCIRDLKPHDNIDQQRLVSEEMEEWFDYVVDCSGHFSTPNVPEFEGKTVVEATANNKNINSNDNNNINNSSTRNHNSNINSNNSSNDNNRNNNRNHQKQHTFSHSGLSSFPGRILHSHDFRNAREFAGQDLLVIGSNYSADDIAVQLIKFGAKSVICSYRTKPMNLRWPKGITERPLLTRVEGNRVTFRDQSTAKVDAIIMATGRVVVLRTGYLHHYPYLRGPLRLMGPNTLYPANLYRGIVWLKGGNGRLLHLGKQDQEFSFTMFDVQALWAICWICGERPRPSMEVMERDSEDWVKRVSSLKDSHENIDFQFEYMKVLAAESLYPYNIDSSANLHKFIDDKEKGILVEYRDRAFPHFLTGEMAAEAKIKFMDYKEDIDLDTFLSMY